DRGRDPRVRLRLAARTDRRRRDRRRDLGGFRLWRLHGRAAGQRERPRLDLRPALRLLLGLRRRLRPGREDRVLGLAGEQSLELILVDRLALDEDLRDPVQVVDVLEEHLARDVVALFDDPADFVVDLARNLFGVVGLAAHLAAEERHVVVPTEDARAELLA